ncbi:MAG: monofunctional biosynthetic peptidoglycan transglycosylase [Ignavibacteriae bacterium]|nr:monofunctional biosynthetic peptidoglycan transglycosylase [Ignavibacteriota bacterium]
MIMIKRFFKILIWCVISFFIYSIVIVVLYKFVPPPVTPVMVIRVFEGLFEGKIVGITYSWVSYDDISPNMFRAVVSGEDARFMRHEGIDWKAVKTAQRYNELHKGKRKHGASTITMQTAKNAFLWHGRNYVRKGLEVYFTYLIEFIWGKKRIIEVYVNIVEFGDGLYGVEAASRKFFNKSAKDLTRRQSALLGAVLPNPRRWSPASPTRYIEKRVKFIQGRMNSVQIPK